MRQRPLRFAAVWALAFVLVAGALIGVPVFVPLLSGGQWVVSKAWPTSLLLLTSASLCIASFVAVLAALIDEMNNPRVADVHEAERVTALRVLTSTQLSTPTGHPARRAADKATPPWLVPGADDYRILAWHLASQWPKDGIVTVAAPDPLVSAVVGTNLAASFASDARATLLVDADFLHEPVRHLLDLGQTPGLVAVMENRRRWTESLVPFTIGRGRTLHVLPAGHRDRVPGPSEAAATAGEIGRAARRHDATVVTCSTTQAISWRAGDDVILCVVRGETRLGELERTVATLIDHGARVRGIVLWEGRRPDVRLPNPRRAT